MPVVTAVPAVTAAAQLLFANTLEVAIPTLSLSLWYSCEVVAS